MRTYAECKVDVGAEKYRVKSMKNRYNWLSRQRDERLTDCVHTEYITA